MPTELAVGFDDMTVLTEGDAEGDVDVFVLNLNDLEDVPPYYLDIAGRRFAFSSQTFPVKGHSALLPRFVREQEAQGNLVVLGERDDRYMAYVHDPNAEAEDEE